MANHRPPSHAALPAATVADGGDPCTQEHRICALEKRADDQSERFRQVEGRMHDGETRFVRLEEKLMSVSEKLAELSETIRAAVRWVLGAVGLVIVGALVWAVANAYHAEHPGAVINTSGARP